MTHPRDLLRAAGLGAVAAAGLALLLWTGWAFLLVVVLR